MCCCGTPTINGQPGYRWQPSNPPIIRQVDPPDLQEGDILLFDEPGRCGAQDSHSHHFRVVRNTGALDVLVRHGSGDQRHRLGWVKTALAPLEALDSNGRYWLLCAIHHSIKDAVREAVGDESYKWRKAAAEKRIKTRKYPTKGIKVWIEDAPAVANVA